jgi:ataxin-10
MRLLNTFLPRIIFGKSVAGASPGKSEMEGFSYLKRDLVRLLGLLSYENKMVQDRTRLCGGLEAVLNLCAVDERNPCKRTPNPLLPYSL